MRTALRASVGIALIAAALFGTLVVYLRRSLPRVDGALRVDGLASRVEMVRDRHAVPHIRAGNDADAQFALGFAHAQDRLWQIELNRRLGSGTLAVVFGPDAIGEDRFFRTLPRARASTPTLAA
jgi:penicillin amidase